MEEKDIDKEANDWAESYKDLLLYGIMVRRSTVTGTERVNPRDVLKDFPEVANGS